MTEKRPHAIILAGPNGAGKSTVAPRLLAGELEVRAFVNADTIAKGLAGFDPASAAIEAGRVMIARLAELRRARVDFAFETTLSGLWLRSVLSDLQTDGYLTTLVYVWVPNPEISVLRVRARVAMGGHDVPEADIRRRFHRSVRNVHVYRRLVTSWWLFDATKRAPPEPPLLVAHGSGDTMLEVLDDEVWEVIRSRTAEEMEGAP